MEPEKNNLTEQAMKNFQKREEEIDGQPRTISVPQEEPPYPREIIIPEEQPPVYNQPTLSQNHTPQGDLAPSYNPNLDLANNGLNKDQPDKPLKDHTPIPESQSQETPINPKETAPDIGKNYGDSLTRPATTGTPIERENPASVQPGTQPVPSSNQSQTGRPNELEQAKAEKEKKQKEADSEQKRAGETSTRNPEAPDSQKKPKRQEDSEEQPAGNGYGALKNPRVHQSNDSTELARRNMEHQNRVKQGEAAERGRSLTNTKQSNNQSQATSGLSGIGSRIKNAITSGLTKRKSESSVGKGDGKGNKKASNAFKGAMKKKALEFLAAHPFAVVVIVLVIFILILFLVAVIEDGSNGKGKKGTHCTYNLNGVTLSGSVELSNLKVELINCDGTASNYTVLETVDFEKYVLGVALAEIGPDSPEEAIKAQIIAARGFALTRNSSMCPGDPDNCFYGYNATTGNIRMRACEADQVYWDYNKDIYREDRGSISIYSPEITSGTLWKSALSDQRKEQLLALANEVKGEVLVDSSDKVIHTSYVATTSEQFIAGANEGKKYDEILSSVYDTSSSISKATCSSYGNIDYGDYILSTEGTEILHQPLDSFLESKGTSLEEFNELIAKNVDNAGYGTRAGVVAAAVTLIGELGNNYGVKVPYYWGGGHYDGVVDGALGYWGSTQCHTYANNTSYNYCGLDCSGFVPWAIKNGGFNMSQDLAGNFKNLPGVKKVSLSNSPVLEPGDLLESSGHIVLVIGIEEEAGVYICAEASGNSSGVQFTRRSFTDSGYWGVKMDGFYDTRARSK